MANKKAIELESIKNPLEKKILNLLNEKGECLYGEIIKELRISSSKGQEAIFSLLKQGLIIVDKSSSIKLNSD